MYGGRSGEHEVSLASAAAVFANLDRQRYEPVPIRIEKDGRWALADGRRPRSSAAEVIEHARLDAARPVRSGREVHLVARPSAETMLSIDRRGYRPHGRRARRRHRSEPRCVFPSCTVHTARTAPSRACSSSPTCRMSAPACWRRRSAWTRRSMKVVFAARRPSGLPLPRAAPSRLADRRDDAASPQIERALGFPMFVKPANLGSSVGISKAKDSRRARRGDGPRRRVRPQDRDRGRPCRNAREIECAVLGNDEPEASVPGEIVPSREFYDYEAKYLDDGSRADHPGAI